jgi:hypothetical protein
MTRQVTINGQEYTVATITAGVAKGFKFQNEDAYVSNTSLIAASLKAGGCPNAVELADSIPIFDDGNKFSEVLGITMEVNGLKPEGEAQAGTEASTGDGSTGT